MRLSPLVSLGIVLLLAPLTAGAGALEDNAGSLYVVVVDEAVEPAARLPYANLVVMNAYGGEVVLRANTGPDGAVDLVDLPFGRYIVMVSAGEYARRPWRDGRLVASDDTHDYCDSISPVTGVTPEMTRAAIQVPLSQCGPGGVAAWFTALGPQGGSAGFVGGLVGIPIIGIGPIPNTR